ncbi:MAG TPA: M20/M25/M40 family metallo-hydrolase [Solirubrobacteraceae bacterium]|nr:M20/M25/M40 family metallo-hydrolase [Solirubrobacteraceae bacterium]
MAMSELEQRVCAGIAAREAELVALAGELIAFDTTAREVGDPPRGEAACQRHLADRLAAAGAEIDVFEPDAGEMAGAPLVPPGLDFRGRPQLIARIPGAGGRSGARPANPAHPALLLNGHIDVVSAEPRAEWTSDPFTPSVRDGRLYGRGACDMKGGIAAMTFAAEVLASLGVHLAGDLVLATNTDEESSGAGGSALVRRGLRADAGIVTEPTGFRVWVACRGSEYGVVTVPGRPGHAEVRHPDWRNGGAVNAIEKAGVVLEAIAALRARWADDPRWRHPHLSVPSLLPTVVRGGEWAVTYPSACELTIAVMYVPAQADAEGWGSEVRQEVEQWIRGECARRDDWLAEHPPAFDWWANGVMPMEIPPATPIVDCLLGAGADVGRPSRLGGLDSWYDGATFTHLAGIPSVGFGPPGFDPDGATVAHTIDEYVPIGGLVACAQALAVTAMRFCGVAR